MGSTLIVTVSEAHPPAHVGAAVHRAEFTQQGLVSAKIAPWIFSCEAYWTLLCSCLKVDTRCIDSGPLGMNSGAGQCKMLPVTGPGNLFGATGNPMFVAAYAGSGCMWKGTSCAARLVFTSIQTGSRSATVPKIPEISFHCQLPVRLSS